MDLKLGTCLLSWDTLVALLNSVPRLGECGAVLFWYSTLDRYRSCILASSYERFAGVDSIGAVRV